MTDPWFRPVAFANGPDGALYIADLYGEILDFSDGIPESIERFKDERSGSVDVYASPETSRSRRGRR